MTVLKAGDIMIDKNGYLCLRMEVPRAGNGRYDLVLSEKEDSKDRNVGNIYGAYEDSSYTLVVNLVNLLKGVKYE